MKYDKVTIIFWDNNKNFKLYCYTLDGIYFIISKYKYNLFKTKINKYVLNKIDTNYIIEYYENKYRNINIDLKFIINNKTYKFNTINKIHKIKLFFNITEVDPPPKYKRSSLITYNFLNIDIPKMKLDINFLNNEIV